MKKVETGKLIKASAAIKRLVRPLSISIFLSTVYCLLPAVVSAGVPVKFTYQGNLRQAGFLVNGSRNMVFRIYASSDTMTPLWTSPPYTVQVSTGVFRVTLEPAGLDLETGNNLWLEMEVESIKLSPREEITSVPFSIDSLLHSGKRYTSAPSAPALPSQGDLWMDTAGLTLKYWNGSGWIDTAGTIIPGTGDNLGNHVATTTLNMANFSIINAGGISGSWAEVSGPVTASSVTATGLGVRASRITLADNVLISSETSGALGGGVRISSNVYIVGFTSATKYYGDGSALMGISGDNLGDHVATTALDMNNWNIINVPSLNLGPNVYVSSATAAELSGVYISSNVYIVGVSSAAKYYGDGSALTGLAALADNLGNHTAVKTLDMAGQSIVNVASATFTRSVTVYSTFTVLAPDSAAASVWISTSNMTPHLYISTGGSVGLGTASPVARLDVAGGAGNSGSYIMILKSGPKIAAWLRNK